jgi:hypothetical protein
VSRAVQPDHWIAVDRDLPKQNERVLVLVADPTMGLDAMPAVARLQIEFAGTPRRRLDWWTGLPGGWTRLPAGGWVVTHWTPLPTWRDGHWMTRGTCLGMEGPDAPPADDSPTTSGSPS